MKQQYNFLKIFISAVLIVALSSCNPEKKLAIEFVSQANIKSILVLTPEYLYKTNLKTYLMDSLGIGDDENKDSLLLLHSKYLSKLNDSLFIANYILGYKKALQAEIDNLKAQLKEMK